MRHRCCARCGHLSLAPRRLRGRLTHSHTHIHTHKHTSTRARTPTHMLDCARGGAPNWSMAALVSRDVRKSPLWQYSQSGIMRSRRGVLIARPQPVFSAAQCLSRGPGIGIRWASPPMMMDFPHLPESDSWRALHLVFRILGDPAGGTACMQCICILFTTHFYWDAAPCCRLC